MRKKHKTKKPLEKYDFIKNSIPEKILGDPNTVVQITQTSVEMQLSTNKTSIILFDKDGNRTRSYQMGEQIPNFQDSVEDNEKYILCLSKKNQEAGGLVNNINLYILLLP